MRCSGLLLVLGLFGAPAFADGYMAFQSPSGNIICAVFDGEWSGARCDMLELTPSHTKPPADCDLDWGSSFWIGADDRRGSLACVGDAVADDTSRVLPYGKSVTVGQMTCVSQRSGVSCTNAAGHGFTLSKARQQLF